MSYNKKNILLLKLFIIGSFFNIQSQNAINNFNIDRIIDNRVNSGETMYYSIENGENLNTENISVEGTIYYEDSELFAGRIQLLSSNKIEIHFFYDNIINEPKIANLKLDIKDQNGMVVYQFHQDFFVYNGDDRLDYSFIRSQTVRDNFSIVGDTDTRIVSGESFTYTIKKGNYPNRNSILLVGDVLYEDTNEKAGRIIQLSPDTFEIQFFFHEIGEGQKKAYLNLAIKDQQGAINYQFAETFYVYKNNFLPFSIGEHNINTIKHGSESTISLNINESINLEENYTVDWEILSVSDVITESTIEYQDSNEVRIKWGLGEQYQLRAKINYLGNEYVLEQSFSLNYEDLFILNYDQNSVRLGLETEFFLTNTNDALSKEDLSVKWNLFQQTAIESTVKDQNERSIKVVWGSGTTILEAEISYLGQTLTTIKKEFETNFSDTFYLRDDVRGGGVSFGTETSIYAQFYPRPAIGLSKDDITVEWDIVYQGAESDIINTDNDNHFITVKWGEQGQYIVIATITYKNFSFELKERFETNFANNFYIDPPINAITEFGTTNSYSLKAVNHPINDAYTIEWSLQGGSTLTNNGNNEVLINWNAIGNHELIARVVVSDTPLTAEIGSFTVIPEVEYSLPEIRGKNYSKLNEIQKYEINTDFPLSLFDVDWTVTGGTIEDKINNTVLIKWNNPNGGNIKAEVSYENNVFENDNIELNIAIEPEKNISTSAPISTNQNYIKTSNYQEPTTVSSASVKKIETITYYDVLGRPKQEINLKAGGNGQHVIKHIEYDVLGQQTKDYLPYASSNTSEGFRAFALNETLSFYETEKYEYTKKPFSETLYDTGDPSMALKIAAPGDNWDINSIEEHSIRTYYDVMEDGDNVIKSNKRGYNSTQSTYYEVNGRLSPLYKKITKNENYDPVKKNDNTMVEFKDHMGRTVLARKFINEEAIDTYYVYDNYENLVEVIPSFKPSTDSRLPNISSRYLYKYDDRNRVIEKKIPGKDWEYVVYNNANQPILTQDALLRENNEWLFTKYDAFGRVTYTGVTKFSNADRNLIQAQVSSNGNFEFFETAVNTPITIEGKPIYYSNNAFPFSNNEIHTINYYDNYNFGNTVVAPVSVLGQNTTDNAKGLPTASRVRVLGTDDWITSVTYYDKKARPIYIHTTNTYLNTLDITQTLYEDFTGRILKVRSSHQKDKEEPIVTQDVFTYDHMGRLLDQHQCIGNETLSEYCGESDIDIIDHLEIKNEVINTSQTKTAGSSITLLPNTVIEAPANGVEVVFSISDDVGIVNAELIAHNTYDELGKLESKKVGNSIVNPLQVVDFKYNIRDWLIQMNNPNESLSNDLFAFKLNYNTTDIQSSTPLFNGMISEAHWKTSNDNILRNYSYEYDALNRITAANSNESGKYNLSNISYDSLGNILNLSRNGITNESATTFGTMDSLRYNYSDAGSLLMSVTDDTENEQGFKDGNTVGIDYEYDANGNMISDRNKNITNIEYNHFNLPTRVTIGQGSFIDYVYDATGQKLQKKVSQGSITDYAGNYVYETIGGIGTILKFANHSEGYIEPQNGIDASDGFDYVYQYKDHLGNIRLSYADDNNDGEVGLDEIREEKNYYPFGLTHKGYNNEKRGRTHNYGFGGKEENDELGLEWLDFSARNYDATIGRFMNLDPLADTPEQFDKSPFAYTWNNPVNLTDFTGLSPMNDYLYGGVTIRGLEGGGSIYFGAGGGGSETSDQGPGKKPLKNSVFNGTKKRVTEQLNELSGPTISEKRLAARDSGLEGTGVSFGQAQLAMDGIGASEIPVVSQVADLISAGMSASQGDWWGAGMSLGGMFPVGLSQIKALRSASRVARNFEKGGSALTHFNKHGNSVMNALGETTYTLSRYVDDANHVINTGTYLPELNAYYKIIGGSGSAKIGFTGVSRTTGQITTFHIKSAKELSKKVPHVFK